MYTTLILAEMFFAKSPFWLQWLYPNLTWHESRKEKYIYITFDDGPIPIVTPFVLKTLKKFNAKATFFCIGDNIRKHPEIFEQVLADGHALGNHTYHHVNGWTKGNKAYLNEFKQCDELVKSNLFRPPYGRITQSQIKQLKNEWVEGLRLKFESEQIEGEKNRDQRLKSQNSILNTKELKIIMWDVLSYDFDQHLKPEACLENVIKNTENGSIVVFHDSLKAQERLEYTLPRALAYWTKKGYQFKTW